MGYMVAKQQKVTADKGRGMFLAAYTIQLQAEKNRVLNIVSHKLSLLSMYVCPFLSLLSRNNVLQKPPPY